LVSGFTIAARVGLGLHDRGQELTGSMITARKRRYTPESSHDHGFGNKPATIMVGDGHGGASGGTLDCAGQAVLVPSAVSGIRPGGS
jgi:hypothetical protein